MPSMVGTCHFRRANRPSSTGQDGRKRGEPVAARGYATVPRARPRTDRRLPSVAAGVHVAAAGDGRDELADEGATPPRAGASALATIGELIAVEPGPDEHRRGLRERVGPQQLQRGAVTVQQLAEERHEPRL